MAEKFKFRSNDNIGAAAAEDDTKFLNECFIDNGSLEEVLDNSSNKQIVIGRTGSGKSALLWKIMSSNSSRCISLSPDNLALTYISNSDIIISFSEIGINLDPFFKLLWRHILTIEILKKYTENHPGVKKESFIDNIWHQLKGKGSERRREKETLEYLKQWGEKFWLETEYRVREITQKLEEGIKSSVNAKLGKDLINAGLSAEIYSKLSDEQKIDVKHNAQKVISSTQVQDLAKVIELIDSILDNRQETYYIVIDGLDENWIEDKLRYRLIMALIVTIRDLNKVQNVKIVISMRRDLIDRVFREGRTAGFQEEKYKDYYTILKWSKDPLIELLDKRINFLIRDRFQKNKEITHTDILPARIHKQNVTDYIFERVNRPRDVIAFFNTCLQEAGGASKISSHTIRLAEGEYSRGRLRALADEWQADFPYLIDLSNVLKKRTSKFKISTVSENEISELALDIVLNTKPSSISDRFFTSAKSIAEGNGNPATLRKDIFRIFYITGLVGLKLESFESYSWADETGRSVSSSEITDDVGITIKPSYHRALGIKP